jgi:hypothetical protein
LQAKELPGVDLLKKLSVEAPGLDSQVVKLPLLVRLDQDVLLDGFLRHQAVNMHLSSLSNTVAPVLSLFPDITQTSG